MQEYTATIEIPKGCDRRIHMSYDKSGFIDLGSIKEQIPINEGVMPVHYGYINNTINKIEGDEIDVLVFSNKDFKTGDQVEIKVIGMITRADGDHKIIAIDETVDDEVFNSLPEQEKKLILDYFGYKSPIISIDSKESAILSLNK